MSSSYDGRHVSFVGKSTIYVSKDFSANFTQLANTISGIIYYSMQMNTSGQNQVAISQGVSVCNIYVSTDYDVSFVLRKTVNTNNAGRWSMTITPSTSGQFINVGGGGGAGDRSYYSNDYGATFTGYGGIYNRISSVMVNNTKIISLNTFNSNISVVSPLSNTTEILTASSSFIDAIRICCSSGNIVIIISDVRSKYWISTDSGATFTEKSGFPTSLIYAKFIDNILYLCSSTAVFKSVDYSV